MIQNSKFLGGDMEHTHLVKGLDYALLQKVDNLFISSIFVIINVTLLFFNFIKLSLVYLYFFKVRSEITSKESEDMELEEVLKSTNNK